MFQIALPTGLVHSGLSFMDAGRSAILVFTIPLWGAPIAFLALGEWLTCMNLVGLAMGLAGIAVLFNPLSFYFSNPSVLTGNGFMFLASMSFAVAIILIRRHTWRERIIVSSLILISIGVLAVTVGDLKQLKFL